MKRNKLFNKECTRFKRKKRLDWEKVFSKVRGEEIVVHLFEIATNPTIAISEIKARRFYIIDRAQIKEKSDREREEDEMIFKSMEISATREDKNPLKIKKEKRRNKNEMR